MKLGLIGLPQSGKTTVFAALTGARGEEQNRTSSRGEAKMATVTVLDDRVDFLTEIYQPKKTTHARIEYLLPSQIPEALASQAERGVLNRVRMCDALLHVVRNFKGPGDSPPSAEEDFWKLEEEMIVSDLMVVERRIERIEEDRKRGKRPEGDEYDKLRACLEVLDGGQPLRKMQELASDVTLKGFTFLSSKPMLVILNNEEDDEALPPWSRLPEGVDRLVVRGRLEREISSMPPDEVEEFLDIYHIRESALDRVITRSYRLLDRISFFTVLSDEVRAWTIPRGTPALEAAGTVHSDMKKGFIRAEVLSFEDLKACGTFQNAKKAGLVRLEGKEYEVRDGDIIGFRFNL